MAYSERYQSSLVFSANTDQAKKAIESLQNQFNMLLKASSNFNLGNQISQDMVQAQKAVAELQVSLNKAFNSTTGKLDLSSFSTSLKNSGRTLQEYQTLLNSMGPAGQKAFSNLAYQIQQAEIPLRRTGKLANELWTTLKNTARWQLSASLLQGFTGAVQKAYRYSQDLNKSLNDIRIVTGQSVEDMARFAVEANKSAKALSATTTEYTKASLIYYQQGLSDAEVKERTDVTIKMANVSRESAETVSDQMTAVWNNFADGSKTLEYYADVMTALGAATASSTAEITTGLEKFAAVAETVGLSYEYATTALATITDTTRQSADVVGNALKTLFARIQGLSLGETLEDGTDLTKYSEALAKVGISIKEQDGSLKEMDKILDEMAGRWQSLAKDQQVALAQTVAGVRQYTQLVALMDNWDKFEVNLKIAEGAEGTLQEQADIYAESWEAARDRVQASAETIYQALLNDEFFIDLTDLFSELLDGIGTLSKGLGGLPGVLAVVGTAFTKIFDQKIIASVNNLVYNLGRGKNELKAFQNQTSQLLINGQPQGIQGSLAATAYREQGILQQELIAKQEQLTEEQRAQYAILQQIHKQKADSLIQTGEEITLLEKELQTLEKQILLRSSSGAKQGARTTYQGTLTNFKNANNLWQKVEASGYNPATGENLDKLRLVINEINSKQLPNLSKSARTAFQALSQAVNDSTTEAGELAAAFLYFGEQGMQVGPLISAIQSLGYSEEEATDMAHRLRDSYNGLNYALDEGKGKTKDLEQYTKKLTKTLQQQVGTVITFGDAFVATTQTVGQFAMALTQLQGLKDIWNDETLSNGEKFLTLITQVSFTLPMLIITVSQLNKTFSGMNVVATMAKGNQIAIQGLSSAILAANGVQDLNTKITLKQIAVYKLKNTQIYKNINALLAQKAATLGLNSATLSLIATLGVYLIPLALVAAGIALIIKREKELKEASPEGQFNKAKKAAEQFADTLDIVNDKAEELKQTFESYQSARAALDNCTEGTDEFYAALSRANEEALKLLELYPQLYADGAVSYSNGQIIIDAETAQEKADEQNKKQNFGTAYINNNKNTTEYNKLWNELLEDMRSASGQADNSISDDVLVPVLEKALQTGAFGALNKEYNEQFISAFLPLERDLQQLINLQLQQKNGTTIDANAAVSGLLGKEFSAAVVEATAKSYYTLIDKEKDALEGQNLSAEDLFKQYKALYGLEGAEYDASKGKYTLDGVKHDLDVNTMTNAIAASNAIEPITTTAEAIDKIIGDDNTLNTLVQSGTSHLSKQQKYQLKDDKETLYELLKTGAINGQDYTDIQNVEFDPDNFTLADTISEALNKKFESLFSEQWVSDSSIGQVIEQIPPEMRDEFSAAVAQTNWADMDSAQAFGDTLAAMGVELPKEAIDDFTARMMDANEATKNLNESNWNANVKETAEILSKLDVGGVISEEDLNKFIEVDSGFSEYFTKMADGTYMLTQDAGEFYELVRQAQLNEIKEAIQSNEAEINRLTAKANEAVGEEKIALENEIATLEDKNTNNRIQGLSMARTSEEFDQMSSEAEFKAIDKSSEAYKVLRNEIIKTEEARGREAETLQELVKLQNKGEIGNRGYAAGLTKLAKQYPQLNKQVSAYEKAIANSGKDSKEAEKALNDLSEAMSAAQWKTTAQDLYDARYEIRELKAEYGALADEMPEYQQALQDQADALTALFGVEVSPAFAKAHANLIDEYLAGSQKAGYELMWLAEQQSGHIETVVNEYLASTDASAEQIQNVITALDGLSFDIDGTADMTQVIESLLATGATGEQVAKMLNALGSSHIQFEVSSEGWKTMEELTEEAAKEVAESGFMGGRKKALELVNNLATQRYKAQLNVTASGTVPKVDEFELSTVSGKNKGGGSKGTKKVASDEKERFHVITKQIDSATAALEDYEKKRERAFGPLKNTYMDEEIAKTKNLISLQEQYVAEIKDYLASDEPEIKKYGAIIDADSGVITNYDEMMDKQIAKYNAEIEKAGTNEKAQEAAEKAYELFIKALENYEETYAAYLDELAKLQDLQNEKIDKELEHIQDKLDAKLDLEADQLKYLDYLIGKLDDEAYALADALVSLHDKTQPIMNQSDHYADAWEELQRTAEENGGWTQDMIDKLRELRDGLISTNEEMMELQKTIEEKVNEAIAECTDELDKQISRFDTYQNILQNYNDIIDLSGKKFKDYAMMLELSSLMTDNAINKLASSREKLETLGQAQVNAQAKLELAEDSGDQDVIDYWKKTLEDIQIEVENATADMTSAWKEALQSASDAFESQVNLAIDNFKGGLEAFGDLDMISESYDRAEKAAERYLEDFEKTHELSQLGRDITKAMNDTTSAFAKDELAELMAEVNEKQKDGVKMSEYDLEVLKKKFELKQAELALEEAQNSMSQVRLTRDNEGNWSYQYTADQDKIDEALNEYETRLYEVAKLSDEYIDEMSQAIIDNQKDMYEALAGLRAEDFESYEEYEAKVREIVNFYTTQDAYLRDELAKAVGDTEYITTTMSSHYNNLSTSFTTVVDTMLGNTGDKTGNLKTWMESTDNLAEQAEEYFNTKLPEAYKTWEESVADAMEAAGTNTEDFKDDVSGYMEDIGDASDILADDIEDATDDMQDYIENVMDAVWDWQEEYAAAIREMIIANEELIRSMMEVATAQGVDNNLSSPMDESEVTEETQTPDTSNIGMETKAANMASDAEELLKRVHTANLGGYKADGSAGGWKDYARAAGYSEEVISLVSKALNDSKAGGGYGYFYNKAKELLGLASGGYTGEWGPEGRLALLHQKELVLNSQDTENFLAGINILREIAKAIDLQATAMSSPSAFNIPFATSGNGALEQNVHIAASFPAVQDRNEIEFALRNLVNDASQFIMMR